MYSKTPPPHPRAGIALGLVILTAWLGAFTVALFTGDTAGERHGMPPSGGRLLSPAGPSATAR